MKTRLRIDPWSVAAALISLALIAPLVAVFFGLFQPSEDWKHLASTVLPNYITNTLIIAIGISFLSILTAVPTAWFVASFEFPGRKLVRFGDVLILCSIKKLIQSMILGNKNKPMI